MSDNQPAHGGNLLHLSKLAGKPATELLDFSANLNPLGFPEWLRPLITSCISDLRHYPDPEHTHFLDAASQRYQVAVDKLVACNGTEEVLDFLPHLMGKRRAIIPVPAYVDYARCATKAGIEVVPVQMAEATGFSLDIASLEPLLTGDEAVYIGYPNNPTGAFPDSSQLLDLIKRHPSTWFVIDEAFADFQAQVPRFHGLDLPNVVALLSLTKIFALPGLRIGCAVAPRELAAKLRSRLPTWNVNTLAQVAGEAAMRDGEFVARAQTMVNEQREWLSTAIRSICGLHPYPGAANFLLVRIDAAGITAPMLAKHLLTKGIAIRTCENFDGLDERFFRIAVRPHHENQRLIEALRQIVDPARQPAARQRRKTPAIMLQGTASNAGKSVLTAALCRILHQDGLSVAPYKSQNMSLNSFVTRDGLEMGRAQVMQAQACRLEPDTRMNPILLKPNSQTGSQVIVNGKPVGHMSVSEYIAYKPRAFAAAKEAYDSLSAEHDAMVIEGAGSPAEINLKSHDIVNMAVARHAQAPVLLVGDIDRGGLYASFIGTLETMAEWEREWVAGFVVNRFRGQESLLAPANDHVTRYTRVPVLGVVPYLTNLGLPEEDSVTFKATQRSGDPSSSEVDIALIDLPHISNFTDIDPFAEEPDASVRVVRSPDELGHPDAVILPGSKSVAADLQYFRESGLADALLHLTRNHSVEIVGICGGYQMLGQTIADPLRIESSSDTRGLALLPLHSVMAAEKTLMRATAIHSPSQLQVSGYEIHHGQTTAHGTMAQIIVTNDGRSIGMGSELVWGSYLHGLFDADPFRRWFIDRLRTRKGLPALNQIMAVYDIAPALDRLADAVRERIDIRKIYQLMER